MAQPSLRALVSSGTNTVEFCSKLEHLSRATLLSHRDFVTREAEARRPAETEAAVVIQSWCRGHLQRLYLEELRLGPRITSIGLSLNPNRTRNNGFEFP